jgi:hypothetical protein
MLFIVCYHVAGILHDFFVLIFLIPFLDLFKNKITLLCMSCQLALQLLLLILFYQVLNLGIGSDLLG